MAKAIEATADLPPSWCYGGVGVSGGLLPVDKGKKRYSEQQVDSKGRENNKG
jgi:hypothetical protein